MDENEVLDAVDGALRVQTYRAVAIELFSEAPQLDLREGLPDELARMLRGVTLEDPAWGPIAAQLALLRTRGSDSFRRLYLKVERNLLRLAVVHLYVDGIVRLPAWKSEFDHTWDTLRFLEPLVGTYRVNEDLGPAVRQAVNTYGDAGGAAVAAGLSLLASAVELGQASKGPCGTFIGISMHGFDTDLLSKIDWGAFQPSKGFLDTNVSLSCYAWWPQAANVFRGTGMVGAVERKSLERQLRRNIADLKVRDQVAEAPIAYSRSSLGASGFRPLPTVGRSDAELGQPARDAPLPAKPDCSRAIREKSDSGDSRWFRCGWCLHRFAASGATATCPSCHKMQRLD